MNSVSTVLLAKSVREKYKCPVVSLYYLPSKFNIKDMAIVTRALKRTGKID